MINILGGHGTVQPVCAESALKCQPTDTVLGVLGSVTASVTKTECVVTKQVRPCAGSSGPLPTVAEMALALSQDFATAHQIVQTF